MCGVVMGDRELVGYVPTDMGVGGDDYVEFTFCLHCGQIQSEFPRKTTALERGNGAGDEEDDEIDDDTYETREVEADADAEIREAVADAAEDDLEKP
jgi:hypothetical protein